MPTTADPGIAAGSAAHPAGPVRWAFGSPAQHRLAVGAAVLALLSVVITVNAARTRPSYRFRTIAAPAPAAAVPVDASGCPVTARCRVQQRATGLDTAFARAFPAGQVLSVQATVDLDSNQTYRTSLLGLLAGNATVSLSAQCVPGAPRSTARLERTSTAHVDLAGDSVIQSHLLSVLVPGSPGCGVALLLRSPAPAGPAQDAALSLVHDPSVQLPPP